jgi:hypothetical protein
MIHISADWQPVVVSTDSYGPFNSANGGYARYTPTTAKGLTDSPIVGTALPGIARHAIITVKDNPIRWRADGTAPTASEGHYMPAGTDLAVENSADWLKRFKFIDTAAGASEVTVTYFY